MSLKRVALTLALALASTMVGLVTAGPAHALSPCMNEPPPDWCTDPITNDPTGAFTSASRGPSGLTVGGSAFDPNGGPVSVDIMVSGVREGTVLANLSGNTFHATVPVTVAGTSVCAIARNIGLGSDTSLGCRALSIMISPFGALEVASMSVGYMQVTGWAVDPDTSSSISVYVITNGATHGPYIANLYRSDLAVSSQGYGNFHGYNLSVPMIPITELNQVCVVGINVGPGSNATLGCYTFG